MRSPEAAAIPAFRAELRPPLDLSTTLTRGSLSLKPLGERNRSRSVEPSLTMSSSRSRHVCWSTLWTASARNASALYAGMTTDTRGRAASFTYRPTPLCSTDGHQVPVMRDVARARDARSGRSSRTGCCIVHASRCIPSGMAPRPDERGGCGGSCDGRRRGAVRLHRLHADPGPCPYPRARLPEPGRADLPGLRVDRRGRRLDGRHRTARRWLACRGALPDHLPVPGASRQARRDEPGRGRCARGPLPHARLRRQLRTEGPGALQVPLGCDPRGRASSLLGGDRPRRG